MLQSFSGIASKSSQPRNYESEDQSPIEGSNKISAMENEFGYTSKHNVAGKQRQGSMYPGSCNRHKTWYSATISTIEGDRERPLTEPARDDGAVGDVEGNPRFSQRDLWPGQVVSSKWGGYWQNDTSSPMSSYENCDGRRDTYNLMPSIAHWDRRSILV